MATNSQNRIIERRLFCVGAWLVAAGGALTWLFFDLASALSLLAGGALAGLSLAWLRHAVNALVFFDPKRSRRRIIGGFMLRLMLIPLCLYAMIRFLFLGILAAVAGFALFHCSIFIEGILEAFRASFKKHARAK